MQAKKLLIVGKVVVVGIAKIDNKSSETQALYPHADIWNAFQVQLSSLQLHWKLYENTCMAQMIILTSLVCIKMTASDQTAMEIAETRCTFHSSHRVAVVLTAD